MARAQFSLFRPSSILDPKWLQKCSQNGTETAPEAPQAAPKPFLAALANEAQKALLLNTPKHAKITSKRERTKWQFGTILRIQMSLWTPPGPGGRFWLIPAQIGHYFGTFWTLLGYSSRPLSERRRRHFSIALHARQPLMAH